MTDSASVQDIEFHGCTANHTGRLCLQMNCNSDCVQILRAMVTVMCARAAITSLRANRIGLAVDELFANIAMHAYGGKSGKLDFECMITGSPDAAILQCDFRDYASLAWQGDSQSEAVKASLLDEGEGDAEICPGGLGLCLIDAVADCCEHQELADGNHWRLIFNLSVGDDDEC